MMKYASILLFPTLVFFSCFTTVKAQDDNRAQEIIDKAIAAHGGTAYDNLAISFTFRDKKYTIRHDVGQFEYTRAYADSTGQIYDVLTNDGFERTLDGKPVSLTEKEKSKFSNAINSVCYFTLLPNGLNDPAVNKAMIGLNKIDGNKYDVVHISFDEDGGGEDFEDEFVYWINKKTFTIDFLAYSFHVNGGGVRFRVAKDPIEVGGVRFQNYINYKYDGDDVTIDSLPFYYVQNKLTKLSEINNVDIKVISPGS